MVDLILNIDFNQSKKKKYIVLETFQGKIPNLKSNQFSGQLRKINLDSKNQFDNLSHMQLEHLKKFLNDNRNKKISKNTYLISGDMFSNFNWIKDYNCLFYKSKDRAMYKVLRFSHSFNSNEKYIKYNVEENFIYFYDKTFLNICSREKPHGDIDKSKEKVDSKFYIELSRKEVLGYLDFEYNNYLVHYNEKGRFLNEIKIFRDYSYEEKIVSVIKKVGWHLKRNGEFVYEGKDIYNSLNEILKSNIQIYTKSGKKVNTSKFENVSLSYGMDWFDISGNINLEGHRYSMDEVIAAMNRKNRWVEIDGNCIIFPNRELDYLKKINIEGNKIGFSKEQFIDAINIAENKNIEINNIHNLFQDKSEVSVPDDLWNILRDYQRQGVKWLCNRCNSGFGVCLADDMGLGKTLQVIAFLSQKKWRDYLNIIIVPMTLLENWKREINKFSPQLKVKIYHGVYRNLNDLKDCNILLTTYGTCLNDINYLAKINFGCMVIDEAQYIKNHKSKTYKAIQKINSISKIFLTGTPMENNLLEYWSLMKILNPKYLPLYSEVSNMVDDDYKLVKLIKRVTSPFILRRMKNDVLKELPEKTEQIIYCEFNEEQRILYKTIQDSIRDYINSENETHVIKQSSPYILEGLLRLRQICCDPKLLPPELNKKGILKSSKTNLVLDMIYELISNNHKVVLYSDFPGLLKILKKELEKVKIENFYIDGETKNRQEVVDNFENTKNAVFLISLKAGGTGLNLVSADIAILYNPWWNPAAEKQAEDRIYRIGQTNKVTIYKLIMADSIEEKMQELKNKKTDISTKLLEGATGISKLTLTELKNLIL
ncbi:hypothetical protein KCL53_002472 [Clostridium perfringens]|nr:hypothetical protein [Clostridium perfringens]ELC8395561.1 hypothetical protein [Clostridium perfringens]ELC8428877.1 hypothetical protein [Clostridium perfringens]